MCTQENVLDPALEEARGQRFRPGQMGQRRLHERALQPGDGGAVVEPAAAGVGVVPRPVPEIHRHRRDRVAPGRQPPADGIAFAVDVPLVEVRIAKVLPGAGRGQSGQDPLVLFDVGDVLGRARPREIQVGEGVVPEKEPRLAPGPQDHLEPRIVP